MQTRLGGGGGGGGGGRGQQNIEVSSLGHPDFSNESTDIFCYSKAN